MLKKISSLFFRASWGLRQKSEIVVFDQMGSLFLKKILFPHKDVFVLPARQERYYFSGRSFFYSMQLLALDLFSKKYRKMGVSFRELITISYFYGCLRALGPRLVITYIDNSKTFHILGKYLSHVFFFAVQNGHRWPAHLNFSHRMEIPYYFCFGPYDRDLFQRMHFTVGQALPIGSIKGHFYRDHLHQKEWTKIYDVCVISQYRKEIICGTVEPMLKTALINLSQNLKHLIETQGLKCSVALTSHDPEELHFYESFLGQSCAYAPYDSENLSSYRAAMQAEVVVGIYSTLLDEMFGLGKKVMYFNPTDDRSMDFPLEYDYTIRSGEQTFFASKLQELLRFRQDEYIKEFASLMKLIMAYPTEKASYLVVQDKIEKVLQNKQLIAGALI